MGHVAHRWALCAQGETATILPGILCLYSRRKAVLQPAGSVLTEEHLRVKGIDVLFVSPTVHNMYIDRSMILINRLHPAYILPQHFETCNTTEENAFWTRGYPDELKLRLSQDL